MNNARIILQCIVTKTVPIDILSQIRIGHNLHAVGAIFGAKFPSVELFKWLLASLPMTACALDFLLCSFFLPVSVDCSFFLTVCLS